MAENTNEMQIRERKKSKSLYAEQTVTNQTEKFTVMICYKVCVRIPALCSFRDETRRESPQHVTTLRNEILADYINETQVWGKVRIIIIYENQPVDSTRNFDQSRVSMPAVYTATKRRIALKCNQSAGHTCVGVFPAQGQGGH